MLIHPQFDPEALQIGPLAVRWYGLMYLIGFGFFLWLGRIRIRQPQYAAAGWTARDLDDMLMFGVFGVILGGRLGYVLFYKLGDYLAHPASIFQVWEGGMSFHGGFLGVLAVVALFARLRGRGFLEITDLIAPLIPASLAAGRLGNFINGELWGRPTDVPWAMIFPQAGDNLPRHPSQLYQFAGEGLVLLVLLWLYARKPRPLGAVSGMFLIGYGCLRFLAEFARNPDNFLGLLALGMSMGQWLSLPMVLLGVYMLRRSARQGFTA